MARRVAGGEKAVREVPIMWPDGSGGWRVRVVIDLGEGSRIRYAWKDGSEVRPDELDRVAKELLRAGEEGEGR
jgi:hypothetical protein